MWNQFNIERSLNTKGYAIFNLFEQDEVEDLNSFFQSSTLNQAFTTHALPDRKHRKKVHEFLKAKFLKFTIPNYSPIWGNFMYKKPFGDNVQLHADWSYVEETKHRSFNVWSPLVDTSLKNGCLWIVPFSQKIVSSIRGVSLPRFYENEQELLMKEYAVPLLLKKGDAVIYDHRLIHFSNPNYTKIGRSAATMIFVPSNSIYSHFYQKNENQILEYNFEKSDFLINLEFFKKPEGKISRTIDNSKIKGYTKNDIKLHLVKLNPFDRYRNRRPLKKLIKFNSSSSI